MLEAQGHVGRGIQAGSRHPPRDRQGNTGALKITVAPRAGHYQMVGKCLRRPGKPRIADDMKEICHILATCWPERSPSLPPLRTSEGKTEDEDGDVDGDEV